MSHLSFFRNEPAAPGIPAMAWLLQGWSIEVTPRSMGRIGSLGGLLPAGTRVYVAHIDGTSIKDMVATARRISREGFTVMPHFPARSIRDRVMLADWIAHYQAEARVTQALLLAGGRRDPAGSFTSSMDLVESGLFEGFTRLHFAAHPEGNRDIDPDGSDKGAMAALRWKRDFASRTDATVALVTQFGFDAEAAILWTERLRQEGIDLPVHIGITGPTRFETLVKYALACGIGPSLQVLRKRHRSLTRLFRPYTPDGFVTALANHKARNPDCTIEKVHIFPLGGVAAAIQWASNHTGKASLGPHPRTGYRTRSL